MKHRNYTKEDWNTMVQMRKEGASYAEIGEMFGRTGSAIRQKFDEEKKKARVDLKVGGVTVATVKPDIVEGHEHVSDRPKEKTLADFTPREMIKHLYNLGYRIEDNKIVYYEKKVVNIKSVLED